eukprot:GEZU01030823.1.p2 GENE.GEZU01030823.1~~GEZU01030823.1.p2  ORF type:complete len:122 (+),score=8.04 GEZU01030823.1:54-419(+)
MKHVLPILAIPTSPRSCDPASKDGGVVVAVVAKFSRSMKLDEGRVCPVIKLVVAGCVIGTVTGISFLSSNDDLVGVDDRREDASALLVVEKAPMVDDDDDDRDEGNGDTEEVGLLSIVCGT